MSQAATIHNTKAGASPTVSNVTLSLPVDSWQPAVGVSLQQEAVAALEQGRVLVLESLSFKMTADETAYLRPECVDPKTKSVKFSLAQSRLWGMPKSEGEAPVLAAMLRRYATSAQSLIGGLFPGYVPRLITGNTSFRPVEAEGRVQSKRHDDRLLHVDSFPSRPCAGKRLLRVFTNVHPDARARVWRVGEPFADVAARFLPQVPSQWPGSATLLKLAKITKGTRTPYDHIMLHLHDAMKLDDAYQAGVPHATLGFLPGTTWIVFSDQVSHAAMSGQYLLEQTFQLPPDAQAYPEASPLRVLEKLADKKLA